MAIELDYMEYSSDALAQAAYVTNSTFPRSNADIDDEDMEDITDWADIDEGDSVSSQATFDSKSCMKLLTGDQATDGRASRTQDIGSFGARTVFSMSLYHDAIGTTWEDAFQFAAADGSTKLSILYGSDGLYVYNGAAYVEVGTNLVVQDTWQEWTFDVDWTAQTVDVYLDGVLKVSDVDCSWASADTEGTIVFIQYGYSSSNLLTYIDWFKAGTSTSDIIGGSLQCYSEATIKTQGSYSLKGIAAITSSLNKTLTRTVSPTIDLSDKNTIKYWAYALRTGSNFKIGWRDSGLNVIEHTPNIIQSNTWEEQTVDISAVTNADKDAIDRIIFTVLNADAANIIYLDKMFSPQQFTKTFDETLTLSEVISKAPARTFLETITLSESSFIKGIGKTFTETITLSETFGRAISKLLKDTVTLTEVAARDIAIFFQETITLTDNIAKGITRTLSDSLSLTDVFTKVLKWLHISHIATTWNKVTKTLTNWTKTNRTNASWHKKYE